MSYAVNGAIQSLDFNNLVGTNPNTTSGTLNAVWSTGRSNAGYGQTALAQISSTSAIAATGQWANLVTYTNNCASHQGTSITAMSTPAVGSAVSSVSALPTNLTTIYAPRLNAATQGLTTSNAATTVATWSAVATFTHTVTFANGDAARYFFNSGGQLKVTCAHSNSTAGINLLFNNLASNVGTVIISAPNTGTATIAATSYSGVQKVGGGGTTPTILPNNGYYALTASNANIFTQLASTGPSTYLSTFIRIIAKSNGANVSGNLDAGSVITLYTVWDEVPDGLVVGSGSTTTVTAQIPETTYLSNSWGTITIAGSVVVA
jgi:hypothetical protein